MAGIAFGFFKVRWANICFFLLCLTSGALFGIIIIGEQMYYSDSLPTTDYVAYLKDGMGRSEAVVTIKRVGDIVSKARTCK